MITKENIVSVKKINNIIEELSCYKVIYNTDIVSSVPIDTANTDYQAIQEWVADGNTIAEAD